MIGHWYIINDDTGSEKEIDIHQLLLDKKPAPRILGGGLNARNEWASQIVIAYQGEDIHFELSLTEVRDWCKRLHCKG
jgi:hypothetical protein